MYIYILALEVIIIMQKRISNPLGPGGDCVLYKEHGCNLQDTFRLIGRVITMTSWFGITCVWYGLVALSKAYEHAAYEQAAYEKGTKTVKSLEFFGGAKPCGFIF